MNENNGVLIVYKIIEIIQLILGLLITILFCIGAFVFWYSPADFEASDWKVIVFFIVIGLLVIRASRKRHKFLSNFKVYALWLAQNPTGTLEELAISVGIPVEVLTNKIRKMIDKKFFKDAYIDVSKNRVIFTDEYITFTCQNCGGINQIQLDSLKECEYCGSLLSKS